MKLKKLLEGTGVKIGSGFADIDIASISTNSKSAKKNSVFVAIEGLEFDGHEFINEAFKKGSAVFVVNKRKKMRFPKARIIRVRDTRKALSVIAKNFYRSPSERLKVIGITGTNGKTTTSLLVESIFKSARIPCGVIGTISYKIGTRRIPAQRTTPGAIDINILLRRAISAGKKAVVMEVSSHGLDQKRVEDIFFDACIFTNLTREHLDYHGNLERYFASKAKIFRNLKKGGAAIINADDKRVSRIKKMRGRINITYAMTRPAYVSAAVKKLGSEGSSFVVRIKGKDAFSVNTKLVGLHNISNILAAVAAGISQNISLKAIKEGIERVDSVRGRLEPVRTGRGLKVFVDYAHTHDALESVLGFLNQIKKKNIITVFGCGGDRDKGKRPLMGRVAQELSDFVIITNDNPRGEDPRKIARDIEKGMDKKKNNFAIRLNRKKAIEEALKRAGISDIVLIAGKGHETLQITGTRQLAFDDRKVVEKALK
jgi:UDP-N-acetylmuramoyl-L-alanyl-D-glutamate--2,6-diaminopimelate ligase